MYKQVYTRFCGDYSIREYIPRPVGSRDILLEVWAFATTFIDYSVKCCNLIVSGDRGLGSTCIGRIVEQGVLVDEQFIGSIAVLKPSIDSIPVIDFDGCATELVTISINNIEIVPQHYCRNLYAMFAPLLSIPKKYMELLKGRDVLILGFDISTILFSYYASKNSSRVYTFSKYVLWPKYFRFHYVSPTNIDLIKKIDVVVTLGSSPIMIEFALRFLRDRGIVIAHPIDVKHFIIDRPRDLKLYTLRYSDLSIGLKNLELFRNIIESEVKVKKSLNEFSLDSPEPEIYLVKPEHFKK